MTATTDDRWLAGDAYEGYMGRWSRSAAEQFVGWLSQGPGEHWLEIGCGTGALTAAICARGAPASVVACEPAEPLIEYARQHNSDPRIDFQAASAEAPPTRAGGFDVAVSGLVLNFLPDPSAALKTMGRRLRGGGTLAAYVWDYADGMEFLRFFWDEAVALHPGAGVLDEARRFPLCREGALASLWHDAGLARVTTRAIEIATGFASFDDYWTPFLRGTGPAPAYVASLEPERREDLRRRLQGRLDPDGEGRIALRARAWAVRGIVA